MGQTLRELTPHASLRHFFGAELREWRQQADLSHDRLGTQVNFSGDLISKVEKADRMPTATLAKACDQVLETGGALSRLFGLIEALDADGRQTATTARAAGSVPAGVPLDLPGFGCYPNGCGPTVRAAAASGRREDGVNRFEFITAVFGTGTVAGATERAEPSRLGHDDVTSWRHSLSRLRELDNPGRGPLLVARSLAHRATDR